MSMKRSIEKKLGCTIEEFFEEWEKTCSSIKYECEMHDPLSDLTFEELDFLTDYINSVTPKAS